MKAVLHDLSLPSFRTYAHRWQWEVEAHDLAVDGAGADAAAQGAKWQKVRLLREALTRYSLVLWLDADVLVMRTDDDITAHLSASAFQGLVLEHVPSEHRVNPNTGVWLLRSCAESLAFLDQVQEFGQQPGPWADQGAVLRALGWDRGDELYRWAKPGAGSRYVKGTSWLPTGWNQPYQGPRSEADGFNSAASSYADRPAVRRPQALHFMGMTVEARYRAMHAITGRRRVRAA